MTKSDRLEHAGADRAAPSSAPGPAATLEALLHARRSVRGFHSQSVPPPILARLFEMAQQAPSNCNAQPWFTHVVSGATAERIREALYRAASDGLAITPDVALTGGYPGVYRDRQIGAAKALFAATGVGREDLDARRRSYLRNFRFFDAPHAAFIFMPDWAGAREAADCGMYAQSLMLAMTALGLGSCAQGALSHYAAIVREVLGIEPGLQLLFGIAFGYEDADHSTRSVRPERLPLVEAVRFHD